MSLLILTNGLPSICDATEDSVELLRRALSSRRIAAARFCLLELSVCRKDMAFFATGLTSDDFAAVCSPTLAEELTAAVTAAFTGFFSEVLAAGVAGLST